MLLDLVLYLICLQQDPVFNVQMYNYFTFLSLLYLHYSLFTVLWAGKLFSLIFICKSLGLRNNTYLRFVKPPINISLINRTVFLGFVISRTSKLDKSKVTSILLLIFVYEPNENFKVLLNIFGLQAAGPGLIGLYQLFLSFIILGPYFFYKFQKVPLII